MISQDQRIRTPTVVEINYDAVANGGNAADNQTLTFTTAGDSGQIVTLAGTLNINEDGTFTFDPASNISQDGSHIDVHNSRRFKRYDATAELKLKALDDTSPDQRNRRI